jgi:hypothetical protein
MLATYIFLLTKNCVVLLKKNSCIPYASFLANKWNKEIFTVDNTVITFIVEKLLLLVDKPFVVHLEPEWKGLLDCLHDLTDSSFILQPLKVAHQLSNGAAKTSKEQTAGYQTKPKEQAVWQ